MILFSKKRYKSDVETNGREVELINSSGQYKTSQWKDIAVGDIVKVYEGEQFPADMILVSSSDTSRGEASIQTANLDGY